MAAKYDVAWIQPDEITTMSVSNTEWLGPLLLNTSFLWIKFNVQYNQTIDSLHRITEMGHRCSTWTFRDSSTSLSEFAFPAISNLEQRLFRESDRQIFYLGPREWLTRLKTKNNKLVSEQGRKQVLCLCHRIYAYQDWNSASEVKIFGRMKFNRDHNSGRLFWRGVPVNSRRFSADNCLSSLNNLQSVFLSLWPCNVREI
jgi:hypothetical protein